MTEYVKIGREDFEIVDWVTLQENQNSFKMEFRTKGNVKAARAMVNAKLVGINGKYCISESEGIQSTVEPLPSTTGPISERPNKKKNPQKSGPEQSLAEEMDARAARGQGGPMPTSTSNI